jgi:HAD superfamily hydrolase (TIGR01509 family)
MDGTLTQTNRLILESFNHIAEKYRGQRYSDEEITKMFGPPEEEALRTIVPTENIEAVMRDYLHFYRANHSRLARLHPGILEILDRLRREGTLVALFTGKGTRTTRISLEECQIEKFFQFVVSGNDVLAHKPSGEGIRKILQKFQLEPEDVLMVGDSVADILSARDAGVRIASVLWDSISRKEVIELMPDFVFDSVPELLEFFFAPDLLDSLPGNALQR